MILSHEGCTSRCWSTELHKGLVVVADFKCSRFVTQRWSFTWTNVASQLYDLYSPVYSKMMFVWLPATSLRAPLSTTSLFTVSHSLIYLKCSQNWGHSSLQLVSNWFHRSMSWCHRSISTLIGHHHTATRVTVNVYRWLSCKYERTSITHRFVHLQYINNEWMICHILAVL